MHSTKNESPILQSFQSAPKSLGKALFLAARPKTWIASLSPVFMGSSLAAREDCFSLSIFFLTLFFALFMQIGANYANDVFDFKNGADTAERIGPLRAVQQGWISPKRMGIAAFCAFFFSILCATPLMLIAGWWSWLVFALCVVCAVLYTGGKRSLGYLGLGELLVFFFFGPLSLGGTYFIQTHSLSLTAWIASLAPGFLSSAMILANNLRDEHTDAPAGKKTLVVRFGVFFGRSLYLLLLFGTFAIPLLLVSQGFPRPLLGTSIPCLCAPIKKLFQGKEVLQDTALIFFAYTLLFCILQKNSLKFVFFILFA